MLTKMGVSAERGVDNDREKGRSRPSDGENKDGSAASGKDTSTTGGSSFLGTLVTATTAVVMYPFTSRSFKKSASTVRSQENANDEDDSKTNALTTEDDQILQSSMRYRIIHSQIVNQNLETVDSVGGGKHHSKEIAGGFSGTEFKVDRLDSTREDAPDSISEKALIDNNTDGINPAKRSSKRPSKQFLEGVGDLAMHTYLKMLFSDFFVHGDLHPGNIFWDVDDSGNPELVYLDCGLAIGLTEKDSENFADCVYSILHGKPQDAGRLIVERSPGDRRKFRDVDGFVDNVGELIRGFRTEGEEVKYLKRRN
jgi:hypothetical protein